MDWQIKKNAVPKATGTAFLAIFLFFAQHPLSPQFLPDILDGHSGFFHTADDLQPLKVAFLKHPNAAGGTLHQRGAFFIAAARSGDRYAQLLCHFIYGILGARECGFMAAAGCAVQDSVLWWSISRDEPPTSPWMAFMW